MSFPARHARRGFTLIEIMAALAVMAILLMIALPAYTDRLVRDQVLEAMALADFVKRPVEAAWGGGRQLPEDNDAAGLPNADKIVNNVVRAVALEEGAIHIAFGNRAHGALHGKILTLRPAVVSDARVVPVTWLCGGAPPPEKMTALGENRTDVPAGLLPLRCR